MGADVAALDGGGDWRAQEGAPCARSAFAGIEIAIAEVEGDGRQDCIGYAGANLPCELGGRATAERRHSGAAAGIAEGGRANLVARDSDAAADIGREAGKTWEVVVRVHQGGQCLDVAAADSTGHERRVRRRK